MLLSVRTGDRLGSYRIVRSIGEGGMGAVFEAVHEQIGRRAAAKILTLDARRNPNVYQRFVNEARAATQIDHPGVVQVFEFGQLEDGTPWMLMELLQGHTLAAYLRAARKAHGAPLGTDGLWIFHDLAAVLARAHSKGIVHRDLKPSNVMIVEETGHGERVKLLDFGIAKFLSESLGEAASGAHHTRTGALLGTPAYMAPEQCKSSPRIDGQADVYALGVMLYELYTAQQPFFDAEPLALMMKKLVDAVPPLLSLTPAAPPEIAALTMAMLERDPSQRPTMIEVQSQLAAFLRIPAARRSGFLPHVTPPDKPAAQPRAAQQEPALPATESGPLALPGSPQVSALPTAPPPEKQPAALPGPAARLLTSAAVLPPTPPEHSSGQLARQPVSLGQQPTKPERKAARALWAGLVVAGASLLAAGALVLWPRHEKTGTAAPPSIAVSKAPTVPAAIPVSAPVPRAAPAAQPDLAAAPVELPAPTRTAAPPAVAASSTHRSQAKQPSRPRAACTAPTAACLSGSLNDAQRRAFVDALKEAQILLCPEDSLTVRGQPKLAVRSIGVSSSRREDFMLALQGALGRARLSAPSSVEIRCPGQTP